MKGACLPSTTRAIMEAACSRAATARAAPSCALVTQSLDLVTGQNLTSPGVCGDQPVLRIEAENGRVILLEPDPGLREVP